MGKRSTYYPEHTVLHIAPTPFFADRGCHIRIRGIVHALQERGVRNVVCTYPIGRDIDGITTARTLPIPGYTKTEAGPSAYKYLADLLLVVTSVRRIYRDRPDILHCHLHEGVLIGWLARLISLRWRTPIVFDMQGSLTGELLAHGYLKKRSLRLWAFSAIERVIVGMANFYFCSSSASMQLLLNQFGVDESLVSVIRDGADVQFTAPGAAPAAIDEGPSERLRVIYSGGLTESKGLQNLLGAVHESIRRKLPLKFQIIGYPTEVVRDYVATHGLESHCEISGKVPFEELSRHLGMADIALEPKAEGSGEASGKVINYMAAGLPVICFDTPNNREMLGDSGYFAGAASVDAFVDQLEYAVRNPGDSAARGTDGIVRVRDHFSWSASADLIFQHYEFLSPRSDRSRQRDNYEETR